MALKGIKVIDVVTGSYDILAVVEKTDLNAIGDLVTGSIYPVSGVVARTVTCLAVQLS